MKNYYEILEVNENASKDMIVDSAVNAQAYEFINNKEEKVGFE